MASLVAGADEKPVLSAQLWFGVTTFVAGLFINLASNQAQAFLDRRRKSPQEFFRNHHLARVVAEALGQTVAAVASTLRDTSDRATAERLADRLRTAWPNYVPRAERTASVVAVEESLSRWIEDPATLHVSAERWMEIVTSATGERPPWSLSSSGSAVYGALAARFGRALREALKDDFAADRRAFGAMLLDLFRVSLDVQRRTLRKVDGLEANMEYLVAKAKEAEVQLRAPSSGADTLEVAAAFEPIPELGAPLVGREAERARLRELALAETAKPVLVWGPPGMGKSALTIDLLQDPAVVARFGDRRVFVRVEGARDLPALLRRLGPQLRLPKEAWHRQDAILAELRSASWLVVLDNFEDALAEGTSRGPVEEFVKRAAKTSPSMIVVSLRGYERPAECDWADPVEPTPLGLAEARALFRRHAFGFSPEDAALDRLLAPLGGVPLAVVLMGHAAAMMPDLAALEREWERRKTAMLERAGGGARDRSLAIALEVSLSHPRVVGDAAVQDLLAVLAFLPDGMARIDLDALFPEHGVRAASVLSAVGLADLRGGRVRMLPVVRTYLGETRPIDPDLAYRVASHYLEMLKGEGRKLGTYGGGISVRRLDGEADNLERTFVAALRRSDPSKALEAVSEFGEWQRFTGRGDPSHIASAVRAARGVDATSFLAIALSAAAKVASARSELDEAGRLFDEARSLYEKGGDLCGVAGCLKGLGDIALKRHDLDSALRLFGEARPRLEELGDLRGAADCTRGFGEIAKLRSDFEGARSFFVAAKSSFELIGDLRGMADCAVALGWIDVECGFLRSAALTFEDARWLYEKVGDLRGVANCTFGHGWIASARSSHDEARRLFGEARENYEKVRALCGVANCIQCLGDIALNRSEHDEARRCWSRALELYGNIPEPYSMGRMHRQLARISVAAERAHHVAAARRLWFGIGRADLVAELDQEFPPSAAASGA